MQVPCAMSEIYTGIIWKRHWPIVVIPVFLMLWSRFGAPPLLAYSYQSVTQYTGIYRDAATAGPGGDSIADQVLIFVVDGLRVDVSRQLPELNRMRTRGAQRVLEVGQPSLSFPGWTAIGTGAWPEQSGVSSNDIKRRIEIDTIFGAARRGGLDTSIVGSSGWGTLFDQEDVKLHVLSEPSVYSSYGDILAFDEQLVEAARRVLSLEPELVLIHLPGVDTAGHGYGGDSEEYAQAAVAADLLIAELIGEIDLSKAAVFVTSDHGHIDSGGHGGDEPVVRRVPLVSVGQGIKPGIYADGKQVDIAATVAVLLGVEIPAHNQGNALLDQIDAPAEFIARRALDVATQLTGRYGDMLVAIGTSTRIEENLLERAEASLAGGDYVDAKKIAREAGDQARGQWQAQRGSRLMRERLSRVPIVALCLLPIGVYCVWWRRYGCGLRPPIIGAILFFGLWHLLFRVRGFSFSASWFNIMPNVFVEARVFDALLALIVVILIVGALGRGCGNADVALMAVQTLLLIGAGIAVQIAAFYLAWGVGYDWYLPDLNAGVNYYLDVAISTIFWPIPVLPFALILPWMAIVGARVYAVLERLNSRGWCGPP